MLIKMKYSIILFFSFLIFSVCKKSGSDTDGNNPTVQPPAAFAKGADISWLTQMEAGGIHFYNGTGTDQDCMLILKNLGMNSVRLRVWVNPANGWNNTVDVVAKAVRAKNLGLRVMIDFHY